MIQADPARAAGVVTITVLSLGLIACAPEPVDESAPMVEPTQADESTPTPETSMQPITIPECPALILDEEIADTMSPYHELVLDEDATRLQNLHRQSLGPVAQESLSQSVQFKHCTWAIPHSDGIEHVLVAELPENVRSHFLAELRASVYSESSTGKITVFTHQENRLAVWYGFEDDLWVAIGGEGHGHKLGPLIFEKLQAVNQTPGN